MEPLNRRAFLARFAISAAPVAFLLGGGAARAFGALARDTRSVDEEIFLRKYDEMLKSAQRDRPFGEVVAAVGTLFIGTPYLAHSLELPGQERLVTNLQAFDCTTFVESTLALARCVRLGERSFERFRDELRRIRYRDGEINGYPSRLHYFTEWIADNQNKGIARDITKELGGERDARRLDFMSTHPRAYRQLTDASNLKAVRNVEQRLNTRERFFLPRDKVNGILKKLSNGDVIGLTTSMAGLDFSHTGLAVDSGGVMRFLHAPLSGGTVMFSQGSLAEYLQSHATLTGIAVARPEEP